MERAKLDRGKIQAFLEHFAELAAGAAAIGVLAVADRAGLLQAMQGRGWVTPAELCDDRFNVRYVTEILSALAAAGLVEYDSKSGRFELPVEHAACLSDPDSPYLMAGYLDMLPAAMGSIDSVSRVTVAGGGVPMTEFDPRVAIAIDRMTSPGMRVLLNKRWLAAMPDVVAKLAGGGRIADVGCGFGTAALTMASGFPNARVTGYDFDQRSIDRATERAKNAGLKNVAFELLPIEELPTNPGFDLITTFDVIHDLSHPVEGLRRIHDALDPAGTYLMMEPKAGPNLEDNFNPLGLLNLGLSVLYCLPQSMVGGGMGLGAAWGPRRAEELCREVGFARFEELPIDNPYSSFYRVEL